MSFAWSNPRRCPTKRMKIRTPSILDMIRMARKILVRCEMMSWSCPTYRARKARFELPELEGDEDSLPQAELYEPHDRHAERHPLHDLFDE